MLLLPLTVAAQSTPRIEVFGGYSYLRLAQQTDPPFNTANLNGWNASIKLNVTQTFGLVADFSGHYGSQNFVVGGVCGLVCYPTTANENVAVHNVLFGPRFSASVGKFRPFVEFEFGVAHLGTNSLGSQTCFANAVGGGLDYRIIRPIAWRFQGDYVSTHFFSTYQTNVRLSTGIVLRF